MKQADLLSRMVFLDTNTYEAKNFQFNSHELAMLKEFIETDHAYLLIGDVTINEIKRHLRQKAEEAVSIIKTAQKKAMILRNTTDLACHGIFTKTSAEEVFDKLCNHFEQYISGSNIEIVPVATADTAKVFEAYFAEEPPFDGAGKKAEFPDAFVLDAINTVSKSRGHKLYVVSNDGDFKRYCALHDNLISISTVGEMLDLIVRNSEELREPVRFADTVYDLLNDTINAAILENFEEAEFSGGDLDDVEFEIDDVEIEACNVLQKRVLEVSKEHAEYEVDVALKVLVGFSIMDYDRSPWDSEDKAYVFVHTNSLVQRYSMICPIRVTLDFQDGIKENAEISEIDIENALDLSNGKSEVVSFYENDLSDEEDIV